jgi:hypothetical protein
MLSTFTVSPHVYAPSRLTRPLLSTDMTGDICYLPYVTWDPAIPVFCSTITSPELGKSYDLKDAVVMQSINSSLKPGEEKYTDFYHWIGTKVSWTKYVVHEIMVNFTDKYTACGSSCGSRLNRYLCANNCLHPFLCSYIIDFRPWNGWPRKSSWLSKYLAS